MQRYGKVFACNQKNNSNPKFKTMAKYSRGAGKKVEKAMHEKKEGTLKSGRSGKKVTSRKQAIAIGLSEARERGEKVPKKGAGKSASKKGASKKASSKGATKKAASKKSASKKSASKKGASKKSSSKASSKKTASKKGASKKGASKKSSSKKSGSSASRSQRQNRGR